MKKDFALGALVATIAVAAILSFSPIASTAGAYGNHNSNIYTSRVCVYHTNAAGMLQKDSPGCMGPNNITYMGLNWTWDKIFGAITLSGMPTVIALGNSSTYSAELPTAQYINSTTEANAISGCGL